MMSAILQTWAEFVKAFTALGEETYGMSPEAATVLFLASRKREEGGTGGCQPVCTGVPGLVASVSNKRVVDIRNDYSGCREFWDVGAVRASITQQGVDYVNRHKDVFEILPHMHETKEK